MPTDVPGIHHVTAIGSDPGRNLAFYTQTLGLRLVKRSVNQDDVTVYHLFYGDHAGSPGTSMTFFPYPTAHQGAVGTGQASTVQFLIPADAVEYWVDRLAEAGVDADDPFERFGDTVVPFRDPDGLPLELVARGASNEAIAEQLVVTPKTVRNVVSRVYAKLGVHRRAEAVVLAREAGLVRQG